jgi:hypothetical protein
MEGDARVPFGSNMTVPGLEELEDEEDVPDDEKVVLFALEFDTDPMLFELPIG